MASYEVEEDAFENYADFLMASQLFRALSEGHASEMASKRTAMENATKNAGMQDRSLSRNLDFQTDEMHL